MFEKMQQLKEMKQLSDSLATEIAEVEKQGIKVVVNGKMKIESIELNSELAKEEQGKILKDCINEAMTKIQKLIAGRMSQVTGLMGQQ